MPRCVFSPKAEADLDAIWLEVARDDVDIADRVLDRIKARCEDRAAFPHAAKRQDHLIPHLRRLIVGPYLVFYFPTVAVTSTGCSRTSKR